MVFLGKTLLKLHLLVRIRSESIPDEKVEDEVVMIEIA